MKNIIQKTHSPLSNDFSERNHKNKYETYECDACKIEDENQEHVMKCEEIKKIQKYDENEVPEYEKIMTGNLTDQIKIAKSFSEKLKTLDTIK